jgi:hypothetical protein
MAVMKKKYLLQIYKKWMQFNCMDGGRPWLDNEHNMITVDKSKDILSIQISLAIE